MCVTLREAIVEELISVTKRMNEEKAGSNHVVVGHDSLYLHGILDDADLKMNRSGVELDIINFQGNPHVNPTLSTDVMYVSSYPDDMTPITKITINVWDSSQLFLGTLCSLTAPGLLVTTLEDEHLRLNRLLIEAANNSDTTIYSNTNALIAKVEREIGELTCLVPLSKHN